MLKKGLFLSLIFLICGCSGAMRLAEKNKKSPTTPSKHIVVKPNK